MKLNLIVFFVFISVLLCTNSQAQTVSKVWGINGHPLNQAAYTGNWPLQMSVLKALYVKYYRVDVPVTKNGTVNDEANFMKLIKLCKANAIQILPVLVFDPAGVSAMPDEAYKEGYLIGSKFENRYYANFSIYEAGNEVDNMTLKAAVEGSSEANYDDAKTAKCINYIKGMTDGIKAGGRKNKVIINMGWLHYGFIELLNKYHVKFDILGLHWYSDMGDFSNIAGNRGSIFKLLTDKFHKPIWVTEFNLRSGTFPKLFDKTYIARNLATLKKDKNVTGCFLYELMDEPGFELTPNSPNYAPAEAHYGLIDKNNLKKDVFYQYRKAISGK